MPDVAAGVIVSFMSLTIIGLGPTIIPLSTEKELEIALVSPQP